MKIEKMKKLLHMSESLEIISSENSASLDAAFDWKLIQERIQA